MSQKQLLIIYAGHTEDGSTATIAGWIADGASKYVRAIIKKASDVTIDDVANADGYALGSGVYNGNPEPDMIEFSESVLNAGKNPNHLDMSNRFVGAFCTSAGYTTGAQPVLNALARIFMTFGASYIGGGNWKSGQGVCGMVVDTKTGKGWDWDPSMKDLQKQATDYGTRLGALTSFYDDAYNNAMKNPPSKPGKKITCKNKTDVGMGVWLAAGLILILVIFILTK